MSHGRSSRHDATTRSHTEGYMETFPEALNGGPLRSLPTIVTPPKTSVKLSRRNCSYSARCSVPSSAWYGRYWRQRTNAWEFPAARCAGVPFTTTCVQRFRPPYQPLCEGRLSRNTSTVPSVWQTPSIFSLISCDHVVVRSIPRPFCHAVLVWGRWHRLRQARYSHVRLPMRRRLV